MPVFRAFSLGFTMQPNQNGNRRLDSWKEIAAHLGRNERTAIRWEKRGLPVHRVPGGQRQAVFAYTSEIDAWLISRDGKAVTSDFSVQSALSLEETRSGLRSAAPVVATNAVQASDGKRNSQWKILIA